MSFRPTLKRRVLEITLGAFMMTAALTGASWVAFSFAKKEKRSEEAEQLLAQNASQQVEQLIPSFLLPEQKDGTTLLLGKIKKLEDLSEAKIVHVTSDLPKSYSHCELNPQAVSFCKSSDLLQVAALIPVQESSLHLGYVLKSRPISSGMSARDVKQFFAIFALILGLTFTVTYLFIARIFSRRITSSLDDLVQWIEADLENQPNQDLQLPFEELENLKDRIADVMERHAAARDQAVVGQLTSGIMHDIRTPLQSVVTAMLLLEKYPDSGEKRTNRLENLLTMCKANLPILGQIIETTLDGSRRVHIEAKSASLNDSVKTGIDLCSAFVSNRKATIEIFEESIEIFHDSVQIARVVQNLVRNAVEATTVGKPQIRITLSTSSQGASIVVEDNGSGLKSSPERAFRVFQSSKLRGNGLGLHISRKIIEAHGGNIAASNNSALGGARFEVNLPNATATDSKKKTGGYRHEATA